MMLIIIIIIIIIIIWLHGSVSPSVIETVT